MAAVVATTTITLFLLFSAIPYSSAAAAAPTPAPAPAPWPHQFHALLFMNYSGSLSLIDLWYDWPNGRNFNIMRDQLDGPLVYDLEWNNGTSFLYTLDPPHKCRTLLPGVGILRPDWLANGSHYLGQQRVDGFLCNVWEKEQFIWYYEDVITKRPVHWLFYTGRAAHVVTFEVGAALEDEKWQAPVYCFEERGKEGATENSLLPELVRIKQKEDMAADGGPSSRESVMRRGFMGF